MASTTPDLTWLSNIPLFILSSPATIPLHLISAAFGIDTLHLTLGSQAPLNPALLNNGEFPACAAMTTGYVFRVENEATIHFLQYISTTGALTHLKVSNPSTSQPQTGPLVQLATFIGVWAAKYSAVVIMYMLLFKVDTHLGPIIDCTIALGLMLWAMFTPSNHKAPVLTAVLSSIMNIFIASFMHAITYWGWDEPFPTQERSNAFDFALCGLFASRIHFAHVLSQRTKAGWYGAAEPGVKGSLLVLLSRDRWVRLDGDVDDLKPVTSGTWLQPATAFQELLGQVSCVMMWMSVLVGMTAMDGEKGILVLMVGLRHVMTVWKARKSKLAKDGMVMQGRKIQVDESKGDKGVKVYGRRLEMADELIEEFGRRDWAEQMGMVKPTDGKVAGEVIM